MGSVSRAMGGCFVLALARPNGKGWGVDQPVGAALNRDLVENYESVERAETEIDAFISRRAQQQQRIKAEQEAWVESARAYNARRHREMREQWCVCLSPRSSRPPTGLSHRSHRASRTVGQSVRPGRRSIERGRMAKQKPAFIKRMEAAREAKQPLEVRPSEGKAPEDMSDAELQQAIRDASEELHRAQLEEMKAIELERAGASTQFVEPSPHSGETLAERLHALQRRKQRHWSQMFETILSDVPELRRIEGHLNELNEQRTAAYGRVVGLVAKVAEAREQDLVSAADALNRGRKLPQARTPKLEAQHPEAEGDLKLLDKRIELLTAERSEYVADHKDELFSLLEREHTDAGNTVSQLAAQTLEALLQMYRAEDEARQLRRTHPEPQPINYSDPSSLPLSCTPPLWANCRGSAEAISKARYVCCKATVRQPRSGPYPRTNRQRYTRGAGDS